MKKVLAVIGAALLFGAVGAGAFFGVKTLVDKVSAAPVQAEADSRLALPEIPAEEAGTPAKDNGAQPAAENSGSGTAIAQVQTMQPSGQLVAMDVADIVEEAMPSIVSIINTSVIYQSGYDSLFDFFYGGRGNMQNIPIEQECAGSGVIIGQTDTDLVIATNNHMVENSESLVVTFCDDTSIEAYVKGTVAEDDIAVIGIPLFSLSDETKAAIKIATLHEEHDIRPGEYVIVIGNSLNMGQTVTAGVVSAVDREVDGAQESFQGTIQTDAAINSGNSGGALLNTKGEVIGINMGKVADTEVEGVCFSIPIYKVMEKLEEFAEAKARVEIPEEKRGRLGVYMNTVTSDQAAALNIPRGVIVVGFSDEEMEGYDTEPEYSPAKEAGILKNDIITKFDGQTITDSDQLADLVTYYEADTEVEVTVQRLNNGEYGEKVFTVKLGKRKVTEPKAEEGAGEEKKDGEPADGKKDGAEDSATGDPEKGREAGGENGGKGQNENGRENNGGQGGNSQENNGGIDDQGGYGMYPFDLYDFFRQYMNPYR